jgi:hypothetical protein
MNTIVPKVLVVVAVLVTIELVGAISEWKGCSSGCLLGLLEYQYR